MKTTRTPKKKNLTPVQLRILESLNNGNTVQQTARKLRCTSRYVWMVAEEHNAPTNRPIKSGSLTERELCLNLVAAGLRFRPRTAINAVAALYRHAPCSIESIMRRVADAHPIEGVS